MVKNTLKQPKNCNNDHKLQQTTKCYFGVIVKIQQFQQQQCKQKLYHQQVCSVFVLGKGYVRITETLLGHPSFRDARRLTASPVQADMLDDFYAYDEDGTRYV